MIIFDEPRNLLQQDMQTLVNPVNTEGVMGAGLALAFRDSYKGLFEEYREACKGDVFAKRGFFVFDVDDTRKVLCLPTKRSWRHPSRLEWIEEGLWYLANEYESYGITSLAIPEIGCGRGQLSWTDVRPLIYQYLDPIALPVGICLNPFGP
jgi:O-acetyl-ADP-ribose deacetylase (regulator of RNase III)